MGDICCTMKCIQEVVTWIEKVLVRLHKCTTKERNLISPISLLVAGRVAGNGSKI